MSVPGMDPNLELVSENGHEPNHVVGFQCRVDGHTVRWEQYGEVLELVHIGLVGILKYPRDSRRSDAGTDVNRFDFLHGSAFLNIR